MSEACCIRKISLDNNKSTNKTILFVPLDCVGHINSLISIADTFKNLGHRTVFLFFDHFDGGLKEKGHEVYDCAEEGLVESKPQAGSREKWDSIMHEMGKKWRGSTLENYCHSSLIGFGSMMKDVMKHEPTIEKKIALIKPDLIVVDHYFIQPAIIKCGKPWARVYSASPLALHPKRHRLPPALLGFPTNWLETKDPELKAMYLHHENVVKETREKLYQEFNEYLTKGHGLEPLPTDPMNLIYTSPFLNVFIYPEELDYTHVPAPENWTRVDSILRVNQVDGKLSIIEKSQPRFEIPVQLKDKTGKLILLSMGTLASGDVELMKRMVGILSKSPNKFIVARGINWQQYELAPNMWGEQFLPQLSILPEIDMIITHGGNNTIIECFYYGVPGFLICPIFSDQFDNAQRIEEIKLGKRLNPFHCSEEEMLTAVEQILADHTIKQRMKVMKARMQLPENKMKGIKLFKDLIERV